MGTGEAGFDFNQQAIRMGLGTGGKGGGGDPVANQKDMLENLFDNIGSGATGLGSMLTGAPNKGELLSTGINKPFEMPEGMHEKMINPFAASFSTQGGFLYKMLSALVKDGSINSQMEGIEALEVGASDYGDGGGGGGGEGGNYGEAGLADFGGSAMGGGGADIEPMIVEYGGRRYEAESMSESVLGGIIPSSGDSGGGPSKGGDIEVG